MTCRITGQPCRLTSRVTILGDAEPGIAQCLDCSVVYEPTGWKPRSCNHCGLGWGESLHDPCLGTLPGVVQACCGHGDPAKAYRIYADGTQEGRLP